MIFRYGPFDLYKKFIFHRVATAALLHEVILLGLVAFQLLQEVSFLGIFASQLLQSSRPLLLLFISGCRKDVGFVTDTV